MDTVGNLKYVNSKTRIICDVYLFVDDQKEKFTSFIKTPRAAIKKIDEIVSHSSTPEQLSVRMTIEKVGLPIDVGFIRLFVRNHEDEMKRKKAYDAKNKWVLWRD